MGWMKNIMGSKNVNDNWEKTTQHEQFISEMFYSFTWEKKLPQSLNLWICPPLVVQHWKHEIPNHGNLETTPKCPAEILATECQQNHFPSMGKMKIIAKAYMENAQELQKCGEDKNMNAWGNGHKKWAFSWLISQKHFSKNWCYAQFEFWPPYIVHPMQ